ncbi:MAG: GGDEF domain-containing phosphodiesterase, partial [Clostridia bacterium]
LLRINKGVDYSIYHIDIENFKVFNEIYGNKFGDSLLIALAEKIDELVGDKGVCGRLSEDNFVAFLPTDLYTPKVFAKKVSFFKHDELHNENVSIRLGIYHIKNPDLPVDHMCDRASLASQHAKEKSLKIANYNDELRQILINEQEVVRDFEQALANDEFTFYLQPVYNITTTKIMSAEALARWIKNDKVIPPMNFIPILEKRGLIIKLDLYILESVCRYLSNLIDKGELVVPISVNLSRISLVNDGIFSSIKDIVKKYKVDKYYLRFEITESSYIANPEKIIDFVKRMRDDDFKIYMDDFGSGYSSLNMLDELPVDILKIDMKFIQNVEKSGRTGNIFASVTRMAKWMNMRVIAEGAETLQQI